jgi:hypothetical protein
MIADEMQQMPPIPPTKKGNVRTGYRTPADANSALFSTTGKLQTVDDPRRITRRIERGSRIAGDMKRALFFAVVLVFVGIVLYQFVTATAL